MADSSSASPIRSHPTVRRMLPVFSKQLGAPTHAIEAVGLDDHVPFSCCRTANCCQGRSQVHGNLVTPTEFAHIYRAMKATGEIATVDDLVPSIIARVAGMDANSPAANRLPKARKHAEMLANTDVEVGDEGVHFMGLYFRMMPDAAMPDGDRCVFLVGTAETGFGCRWHGTRAQPTACALAPIALPPTKELADAGVFFYDTRRAKWCEGMRRAMRGEFPGTTVRTLLERNDGWDRHEEHLRVQDAVAATASWRRGYQNHHSPLAKLYIAQVPELAPLLVGY